MLHLRLTRTALTLGALATMATGCASLQAPPTTAGLRTPRRSRRPPPPPPRLKHNTATRPPTPRRAPDTRTPWRPPRRRRPLRKPRSSREAVRGGRQGRAGVAGALQHLAQGRQGLARARARPVPRPSVLLQIGREPGHRRKPHLRRRDERPDRRGADRRVPQAWADGPVDREEREVHGEGRHAEARASSPPAFRTACSPSRRFRRRRIPSASRY